MAKRDEKCSILLLVREMHIKTTVRKHDTPTRRAEIKKTSKAVEQQKLITCRKTKFHNYSKKQWALASKVLKLCIPFDPVILLLNT